MLMSTYLYFTAPPEVVVGIKALGYPVYFLKILGTAKLLGVLAIVYGRFRTLKEWAYAGFVFDLIGASASHYFSGDPISKIIIPIIVLVFVFFSYFIWKKTPPFNSNSILCYFVKNRIYQKNISKYHLL